MFIINMKILSGSNHELEAYKSEENQIYTLVILWLFFYKFLKKLRRLKI